ncbi:prepilin-type cleavage/methylation domain-containing protein [Pseudomonas sp. UL070]|uniref:Prepilin-type cleavage/methylation domain-containing protein n=2 Tax=Aquipseudomonas ullengensis TaxID=2759166 RepID=A0A7W4LP78_9GAMM|nr:prepilin-type cleavage/methylation domain-containing protein [Pseudomonas ullengensis]
MTLVELVITIVIIGIAAAAMFSAMAAISGRSADPMLRQQSLAIAEAYMEEISLQAFPLNTPCATDNNGSGRGNFDDVCDYNGLYYDGTQPFAPRSAISSTALAGLEAYQVLVGVSSQTLNGVAAMRILVSVTDPAGQLLVLTGYRTSY